LITFAAKIFRLVITFFTVLQLRFAFRPWSAILAVFKLFFAVTLNFDLDLLTHLRWGHLELACEMRGSELKSRLV